MILLFSSSSLPFPSCRLTLLRASHHHLFIVVVQLCPTLWTPLTAARQASLSLTISWSLLKLMPIESVMPSNHLILCCPLFLLPSIFLRIMVFSTTTCSVPTLPSTKETLPIASSLYDIPASFSISCVDILKSSCLKRPEPCRKFSFPAQEALNWLSRDELSHERRGCELGEGLGWPEGPRRSLVTVTIMHVDFAKTASKFQLVIQPPQSAWTSVCNHEMHKYTVVCCFLRGQP